MTRRRSSIKGRGSEILFGTPSAVDIEPRGRDLPLDEAEPVELESSRFEAVAELLADVAAEPLSPPPDPEPLPDEVALERALYEEARDGALMPGEEEDLSLVDTDLPPSPEPEPVLVEDVLDEKKTPAPVADTPIRTLEEEKMEERELSEKVVFEPPPPETSDVATSVLPPRSFIDLPGVMDIQPTEPAVERLELPDRDLTEEEKKELLERLGGARIQELDEEIDRAYELVLSQVGEHESIATECYNQLLKARDIVLRRDAARLPQVEYYVEQVRARLKRATESEMAAQKYGWRITAWGLFWCVAFVSILLLLNSSWFVGTMGFSAAGSSGVNPLILLSAMVWGGIGGVIDVWYSLFKHIGQRDFDPQYNHSYFGKPFLGAFLGAIVYLMFDLMAFLRILPAGLQQGEGASFATAMPLLVYATAWVGGFKENRVFDLVDRVMERIFGKSEPTEPANAEPVAPTG